MVDKDMQFLHNKIQVAYLYVISVGLSVCLISLCPPVKFSLPVNVLCASVSVVGCQYFPNVSFNFIR